MHLQPHTASLAGPAEAESLLTGLLCRFQGNLNTCEELSTAPDTQAVPRKCWLAPWCERISDLCVTRLPLSLGSLRHVLMLWVCDREPHPHPTEEPSPSDQAVARDEGNWPSAPSSDLLSLSWEWWVRPQSPTLALLQLTGVPSQAVDSPGLALLPPKPECNSCASRLRKDLMDNTGGGQGKPGKEWPWVLCAELTVPWFSPAG